MLCPPGALAGYASSMKCMAQLLKGLSPWSQWNGLEKGPLKGRHLEHLIPTSIQGQPEVMRQSVEAVLVTAQDDRCESEDTKCTQETPGGCRDGASGLCGLVLHLQNRGTCRAGRPGTVNSCPSSSLPQLCLGFSLQIDARGRGPV